MIPSICCLILIFMVLDYDNSKVSFSCLYLSSRNFDPILSSFFNSASVPSEWVKLIRETDQKKPFNIVYGKHSLTADMKPDDTPVVTVKD